MCNLTYVNVKSGDSSCATVGTIEAVVTWHADLFDGQMVQSVACNHLWLLKVVLATNNCMKLGGYLFGPPWLSGQPVRSSFLPCSATCVSYRVPYIPGNSFIGAPRHNDHRLVHGCDFISSRSQEITAFYDLDSADLGRGDVWDAPSHRGKDDMGFVTRWGPQTLAQVALLRWWKLSVAPT